MTTGIFEDTNLRTLKELLSEVHQCKMVLPDFQRDFVWEPGATQELIVSIANNYPAGSLLRVHDTKHFFAARECEGAPVLCKDMHTYLVLDGQQRLTSLYQAFYGVGEHRYYLDIKRLFDDGDFEDAIFHLRASTKRAKAYESFDLQANELILPLSELKGGAGGFLKWLFDVTNRLQPDERIHLQNKLIETNQKWIMTIDDYQFPVMTLSAKTEPTALCTIFETLNRTGVKLSVFALLTARFWPHDINLRDLWDAALEKYPIVKDFEVDPYYILQSIALVSHKSPTCKRNDVLNLTADDIIQWWDPVVVGLAIGLHILKDDCKVMLPKWLPYQTMLAPLAAVLAMLDMVKGPKVGVQKEKIKRWFWCSVFGQAYESSPNSQAARDVGEMWDWLGDGPLPESVQAVHFDPKSLRDVTPRQRAIYRGTICLIQNSITCDFHTLSTITGKLMGEEGIDDHHIFPCDFLEKSKGVKSVKVRDCVLNRTLIGRMTNLLISNRAPSDYMSEIRKTPGFPFDTVLKSHLLPVGESSPLLTDDYEAFLAWRQDRLWQEIQRVTGIESAADLEADELEIT